jgi:hypothetical protein
VYGLSQLKRTLKPLLFGLMALMVCAPAAEAKRHHARPHPVPAYISTTDLAVPVQAALKAQAEGKRAIVVFDVDNTLLTAPQDLGGDTWYNWKKSGISAEAHHNLIINNTALLQVAKLNPTQPDTASLIAQLQAKHIAVYGLSARGTDLRGATENVLKANGIDFSGAPECGPPLCVKRGNLTDTDIRAAVRHIGLPLPEKAFYPITVSDGLIMATGQNKGLILNLLLHSLAGKGYTDVYFVDDTFKNITDMQAAAPLIRPRVHPYSYERFWSDSAAFMHDKARQDKADADYAALKYRLCAAIQAAVCDTPSLTTTTKP